MTIRIPPESPAANIIVRLLYPAETTYKMPVPTGYSVYLFSMDAFPKAESYFPKASMNRNSTPMRRYSPPFLSDTSM